MKLSFGPLVLALTTTATARDLLAAADAYAPIKTNLNLGYCLTATSTALGAAVIISPCTGSDFQRWIPFQDRTNVFRFQNFATRFCLWDDSDNNGNIHAGQSLIQEECTLSDGSGRPPSNSEWDTNGTKLPGTNVQLRSFLHFSDQGLCATVGFGTSVVLDQCGRLQSQLWQIDG